MITDKSVQIPNSDTELLGWVEVVVHTAYGTVLLPVVFCLLNCQCETYQSPVASPPRSQKYQAMQTQTDATWSAHRACLSVEEFEKYLAVVLEKSIDVVRILKHDE
jgi:hypothetical protein